MKARHLPYGPSVRVRATFGPPQSVNLVVEVKDTRSARGWRFIARFNDSEPDAHEQADQKARDTRLSLIEGETP